MHARGKVARYENPLSDMPSEIVLSGDGDIPVTFIFTDDIPAFAKGGLVRTADRIKRAGRYGDTEIVHINKDELEELRELWGEPTINPETGCPEYFLKKLFKKVIKPLAKIAPIAAMFIPGIGPIAAAGIGALSGGITGGLKGAVVGGALGGFGGAASKAIQGGLGIANPVLSRAASSALLGGVSSAALGGNPLTGALAGGALGAAVGPGGLINNQPMPSATASSAPVDAPGIANAAQNPFAVNPQMVGGGITGPGVTPTNTMFAAGPATAQQPSWLKQPFLGGAISPSITNGLGYGALAALTLPQLLKSVQGSPKTDPSKVNADMSVQQIADKRFQSIFGDKLPAPRGMYANLAARPRSFGSIEDQYRYGQGPEASNFAYVPAYKKGGKVASDHDGDEPSPFAVRGKGTGRSDDIDAKLSDGEYVMDAETVALLGDGSNEAGAKRLDQMRVNLRKHKGKNLAKGKFSVNAKRPEAYMLGGAV